MVVVSKNKIGHGYKYKPVSWSNNWWCDGDDDICWWILWWRDADDGDDDGVRFFDGFYGGIVNCRSEQKRELLFFHFFWECWHLHFFMTLIGWPNSKSAFTGGKLSVERHTWPSFNFHIQQTCQASSAPGYHEYITHAAAPRATCWLRHSSLSFHPDY